MKSAIFCEHANESPVTRPCRCSSDCYCKVEGGCRPHRAEEEFVARMAREGRAVKVITADGTFIMLSARETAIREIATLRAQLDEIERRIG